MRRYYIRRLAFMNCSQCGETSEEDCGEICICPADLVSQASTPSTSVQASPSPPDEVISTNESAEQNLASPQGTHIESTVDATQTPPAWRDDLTARLNR